MAAYSKDLRERVIADSDSGLSAATVAAKYRVSSSWVRRLKQRQREQGSIEPKPWNGARRPVWPSYSEAISKALSEKPDLTINEIRERLKLPLSQSTVWRAVRALGFTLKKRSSAPASRTAPTSPPSGKPGLRSLAN